MKRCLSVAMLLLVSCCVWGALARAAAPAPATPAGDLVLTPWQPGLSYAGDAQADPRLDQPVQMWRAGLPLRDILADLTRQTGVAFDFWPEGAEEARVALTLYLNPTQPPSLRDLMAQLTWVVHSSFAFSEGPAESRVYSFLGTSTGEGVAQKLAADAAARQEQFRAEMEARRAQERADAGAALEESRRALGLSQEEAVARYRGSNDALLLNLLDPSRRAGLGFLANLPEADTKELLEGSGRLARDWSGWSPEQQAELKQALGGDNWPADGSVTIVVEAGRGGAVMAMPSDGGRRRRPIGRVQGVLSSGPVRRRQAADLGRLLGEAQPPAPSPAAAGQQQNDRQAARAAWQQQQAEQRQQEAEAARSLSAEVQEQLGELSLTPAGSDLWQVQEAVAKATGLSVISDCFWSAPPRFFRGRQQEEAVPANALETLDVLCSGRGPGRGFGGPFGGLDLGGLSLQWSDAGTFLRFRTQRPDVWRAAMLPAEVVTQLDGWLAPSVAQSAAPVEANASPLHSDVEKMSWLAGHVDDVQARLGGAVVYGDMGDAQEARRHELRQSTLQQLSFQLPIFRMLGSLTPKQWARLRAGGLRWADDLKPSQRPDELARMVGRRVPEERTRDMVLQLGQADEQTFTAPDGSDATMAASPALKVLLDGRSVNEIRLGMTWPGPGGRNRGG